MRIAFTSDLHVDVSPRNREAARLVAERMRAHRPDVIAIAGDVGNTLEDLRESLSLFSGTDATCLFVAGNHDVWVESRGGRRLDSREKYFGGIPDVCERCGFIDLGQWPIVLGRVGFVGSLGWYDYTFADPRLGLSEDDYWRGRWEGEIWWDREMTFWPSLRAQGEGSEPDGRARDPEVCSDLAGILDAHLREVEPSVERIVAVVHTLPYLATLPRRDPPCYLDAFTGSERLGRLLDSHPTVTHHIGGHKHLPGEWELGRVRSYRRTLGRLDADAPLDAAVDEAVGLIEISDA